MDERRAAPRLCPRGTVIGRVFDATREYESSQGALVQDLCRDGIGLLLNKPLVSDFLCIDLPFRSEYLLARLAHAARQADGTWKVGLHLITPLEQREVDALGK